MADALGFEHSVANMYLITVAILAGDEGVVPVTLGNIVGGAGQAGARRTGAIRDIGE